MSEAVINFRSPNEISRGKKSSRKTFAYISFGFERGSVIKFPRNCSPHQIMRVLISSEKFILLLATSPTGTSSKRLHVVCVAIKQTMARLFLRLIVVDGRNWNLWNVFGSGQSTWSDDVTNSTIDDLKKYLIMKQFIISGREHFWRNKRFSNSISISSPMTIRVNESVQTIPHQWFYAYLRPFLYCHWSIASDPSTHKTNGQGEIT